MSGQRLVSMPQQMSGFIKADLALTGERQGAGGAYTRKRGLDRGRIERLGRQSLQSQQDRPIRAVATAGQGEGGVEFRGELRRALEQSAGGQVHHEAARRVHRTHGVGTGRSNADLEDVQNAQHHAAALQSRMTFPLCPEAMVSKPN